MTQAVFFLKLQWTVLDFCYSMIFFSTAIIEKKTETASDFLPNHLEMSIEFSTRCAEYGYGIRINPRINSLYWQHASSLPCSSQHAVEVWPTPRTTDTQWKHKSKISENVKLWFISLVISFTFQANIPCSIHLIVYVLACLNFILEF